MSRVGRQPIALPEQVDVQVAQDNLVVVTGPLGSLQRHLHPRMKIVRGAFSSGGASSSRTYSSGSKRFCGFQLAPRP